MVDFALLPVTAGARMQENIQNYLIVGILSWWFELHHFKSKLVADLENSWESQIWHRVKTLNGHIRTPKSRGLVVVFMDIVHKNMLYHDNTSAYIHLNLVSDLQRVLKKEKKEG